jgi:hypothetical protein
MWSDCKEVSKATFVIAEVGVDDFLLKSGVRVAYAVHGTIVMGTLPDAASGSVKVPQTIVILPSSSSLSALSSSEGKAKRGGGGASNCRLGPQCRWQLFLRGRGVQGGFATDAFRDHYPNYGNSREASDEDNVCDI